MGVLFFFYALFHCGVALLFLGGRPVWFPGGAAQALFLAVSLGSLIAAIRLPTHFVSSRILGAVCLALMWCGYVAGLYQLFFRSYFVAGSGPGANPMAGVVLLFGLVLIALFFVTTRLVLSLFRLQAPRP